MTHSPLTQKVRSSMVLATLASWELTFGLYTQSERVGAEWGLHHLHTPGGRHHWGANTVSLRSSQTSRVSTGLHEHWTLPKAKAAGNRQSHPTLQQPGKCKQRPVLKGGYPLITSQLRILSQWMVKAFLETLTRPNPRQRQRFFLSFSLRASVRQNLLNWKCLLGIH